MSLIKCFVLLVTVQQCLAQLKTFQLENTFNQQVTTPILDSPGDYFAAGGKYVAFWSTDNRVRIFEKDDQGKYTIEHDVSLDSMPASLTTNGLWFGALLFNGAVGTFRSNADGSFGEITWFASDAQFIKFLSDNTLVLISTSFIQTYEFINGNWSMIQHQDVTFQVSSSFLIRSPQATDSQPHLTDTTLAAFNPTTNNIELYTRSENKSWAMVDQTAVDTAFAYRANRIIWDGGNNVIYAQMLKIPSTVDNRYFVTRLVFYSRDGTVNQEVYNLTPSQYTGYSMILIDRGFIAVGSPSDFGGSVLYLQRTDNVWQVVGNFTGPASHAYVGISLQRNDDGIVFQSIAGAATALIITPCYLPVKFHCLDLVLEHCSDGLDVSYNQLYWISDTCAALHLDNLRLGGPTATLSLRFTTAFFGSVSCKSTIVCNETSSCVNSPMISSDNSTSVVPTVSPSDTASPVTAPIINASPLSSVIPVASPTTDSKVTSASSQLLVSVAKTTIFLVCCCLM